MNWLESVEDDELGNRILTIRGTEPGTRDTVILDGNGEHQAVHLLPPSGRGWLLRFMDLTFRNCYSTTSNGGAVHIDNHPVYFENVWFLGNRAFGSIPLGQGGALYMRADDTSVEMTFRDCRFEENTSTAPAGAVLTNLQVGGLFENCEFVNNSCAESMWGGALLLEDATSTTFRSCHFEGNSASFGGAVDDGGTASSLFENCTFVENQAKYGGAYYAYQTSTLTFVGCHFIANSVSQGGGAVRVTSFSSPVFRFCTFMQNRGLDGVIVHFTDESVGVFEDCIFSDHENVVGDGLAHLSHRGHVNMTRCTWTNNLVAQSGIIYSLSGDFFVRDSEFAHNHGDSSTVISIENPGHTYTFEILDSTFYNNSAINKASMMRVRNGIILLRNVSVSHHAGSSATILIEQDGVVTIEQSIFEHNVVSPFSLTSGYGGVAAISEHGTLYAYDSVFQYNAAAGHGGVLYTLDPHSYFVGQNVTMHANTAGRSGGAIFIGGGGTGSNLRFSQNRALYGGAVFVSNPLAVKQIASDLSFIGNTAVVGGGGIFFAYNVDGEGNVRPECENCVIRENEAGYGPDVATVPVRIAIEGNTTMHIMRGEVFSVAIVLLDSFGQITSDNSNHLEVLMRQPSGLQVVSARLSQSFNDGRAIFEEISLSGEFGVTHLLNFTCDGLVASGVRHVKTILTVSFGACEAGYEESTSSGGVVVCRQCIEGTFNPYENSDCVDCPDHGYCPGGLQGSIVLASRHSWLDPTTLPDPTLYSCVADYCCPDENSPPCPPEAQCKENRGGLLCGECVDGYSSWGGKCVECPHADPVASVLVAVYCIVVLTIVLYKSPQKNFEGKIAVFSLQTMSLIGVFVQSYSFRLVEIAGAFSLDADDFLRGTGQGRCLFPADSLEKHIFDMVAPIVMIALVGVLYLLRVWWAFSHHRPTKPINEHFSRAFLMIMSLLSMSLSEATFSIMRCVEVRGEWVLAVAPTTQCFGSSWWLAFCVLLFGVFGHPIVLLIVLFRNRNNLYDEYGRSHPGFGVLYENYKEQCYLTDPLYQLRRTLLALVVVSLSGDEDQMWRACVVCFLVAAMMLVQAWIQPYNRRGVNAQELLWLSLIGLVALAEALKSAADFVVDPDVFDPQVEFLLRISGVGSTCLLLYVGVVYVRRFLVSARGFARRTTKIVAFPTELSVARAEESLSYVSGGGVKGGGETGDCVSERKGKKWASHLNQRSSNRPRKYQYDASDHFQDPQDAAVSDQVPQSVPSSPIALNIGSPVPNISKPRKMISFAGASEAKSNHPGRHDGQVQSHLPAQATDHTGCASEANAGKTLPAPPDHAFSNRRSHSPLPPLSHPPRPTHARTNGGEFGSSHVEPSSGNNQDTSTVCGATYLADSAPARCTPLNRTDEVVVQSQSRSQSHSQSHSLSQRGNTTASVRGRVTLEPLPNGASTLPAIQ
eukprot:Rmarinus@m.2875